MFYLERKKNMKLVYIILNFSIVSHSLPVHYTSSGCGVKEPHGTPDDNVEQARMDSDAGIGAGHKECQIAYEGHDSSAKSKCPQDSNVVGVVQVRH